MHRNGHGPTSGQLFNWSVLFAGDPRFVSNWQIKLTMAGILGHHSLQANHFLCTWFPMDITFLIAIPPLNVYLQTLICFLGATSFLSFHVYHPSSMWKTKDFTTAICSEVCLYKISPLRGIIHGGQKIMKLLPGHPDLQLTSILRMTWYRHQQNWAPLYFHVDF